MTSNILCSNLVWSLGGLVVGFILGRLVDRFHPFRYLFDKRSLIGLAVLVITAVCIWTYVDQATKLADQSKKLSSLSECSSESINNLLAILRDRSDAQEAQIDSQIRGIESQAQLIDVTLARDPVATDKALHSFAVSLEDQRAVLIHLKEKRQSTPLPNVRC